MIQQGVILYGPPASGKDTVSAELSRVGSEFEYFRRLKAGPGRTAGYRLATEAELSQLSNAGELLYANTRYGAQYAVDRGAVDAMVAGGRVPVIHLGQVAGVKAVSAYPGVTWTKVLLWCSRETTEVRCRQRGDDDVTARLVAWDETLSDLSVHDEYDWSLVIDTEWQSATEVAASIKKAVADPGFYRGPNLQVWRLSR